MAPVAVQCDFQKRGLHMPRLTGQVGKLRSWEAGKLGSLSGRTNEETKVEIMLKVVGTSGGVEDKDSLSRALGGYFGQPSCKAANRPGLSLLRYLRCSGMQGHLLRPLWGISTANLR